MKTPDTMIEINESSIDFEALYPVPKDTMITIEEVTLSTISILKTEKESNPFYTSYPSSLSGLNELSNISNSEHYLLSPSPFPISNSEYEITIGVSLISKTSKPLNELSTLQFHCQPTLNSDGLPQLNIFIYYDDSPKTGTSGNFYWENIFEIFFPKNAISGVTLSNIETVQVFLTQGDPRTSRGTVTTVKSPV